MIKILFLATELRKNVESHSAKLKYLSDARETLKTDIAVTKRAAEKADVDMIEAQIEKRDQVKYHQSSHTKNMMHNQFQQFCDLF